MRCAHARAVVVLFAATSIPLSSAADPVWQPFGLDTLSVYDLHRAGPFLYACTADFRDAVWRRDVTVPESEWMELLDLDGLLIPWGVWSPRTAPDTIYVSGSFGAHTLWKSEDGGQSWIASNPAPGGASRIMGLGVGQPLFLGASDAGTLFRSDDYGDTWTCALACPNGVGTPADIVFRPSHPDEMWVSVNTGFGTPTVHKSVDGGRTWTHVWGTLDSVGDVAVSHDGIVLIANALALVRSTDGGDTWVEGPIGSLLSIRFGPWGGDLALAGGQFADDVYVSDDDGVTWRHSNDGLPNGLASVWAIEPDPAVPGVFYIGIDHFGVWRIEIPGIVAVSEPENTTPTPLRVLENPARGSLRIALDVPRTDRLDVFDAAGRRVWTTRLRTGVRELTWDGHLRSGGVAPPGTYFLRVPGVAARSFVWLGP